MHLIMKQGLQWPKFRIDFPKQVTLVNFLHEIRPTTHLHEERRICLPAPQSNLPKLCHTTCANTWTWFRQSFRCFSTTKSTGCAACISKETRSECSIWHRAAVVHILTREIWLDTKIRMHQFLCPSADVPSTNIEPREFIQNKNQHEV